MCHQYFGGTAPDQELNEKWNKIYRPAGKRPPPRPLSFMKPTIPRHWKKPLVLFAINKYADERAPWKLAKSDDPNDGKALATSLATMLEGLRLANELGTCHARYPRKNLSVLESGTGQGLVDRLEWSNRLAKVELGQK